MKGQISFDYLAGAMVFFSAILFLVSSVTGVLPAMEQSQQVSELEMTGWALSEVLLEDEGFWEQGNVNGTDWHLQNPAWVQVVGLRDGRRLSRAKIGALINMSYSRIRSITGTDVAFNIGFIEYATIDTYDTFNRTAGNAPSYINEPAYSGGEAAIVHYGSARIDGAKRYALLSNEIGWYNKLRLSEDWDFQNANTDTYNLTTPVFVPIAGGTYRIDAAQTDASDGKLLVLERSIGRVGAIPAEDVSNIVSIDRYAALGNGNLVHMVINTWKG